MEGKWLCVVEGGRTCVDEGVGGHALLREDGHVLWRGVVMCCGGRMVMCC